MRYGYRQQEAAPFSDDDISRIMVCCVYLYLEDLILDAIHYCPLHTGVLAWQSVGKFMVRYGIDRFVPM